MKNLRCSFLGRALHSLMKSRGYIYIYIYIFFFLSFSERPSETIEGRQFRTDPSSRTKACDIHLKAPMMMNFYFTWSMHVFWNNIGWQWDCCKTKNAKFDWVINCLIKGQLWSRNFSKTFFFPFHKNKMTKKGSKVIFMELREIALVRKLK